MERKLAFHIAAKIASHGYIEKGQISVYTYGFELLISTIIEVCLLILISVLLGAPFSWLFFLLGFIPERIHAGGYHAKTHLSCYIIFTSLFTLSSFISLFFSFPDIFPLITSLVLLFLMLIWGPVEATNKPLSIERRRKNHLRALIFVGIDIIFSLLLIAHLLSLSTFWEIYYLSKWTLIIFLLLPKAVDLFHKFYTLIATVLNSTRTL